MPSPLVAFPCGSPSTSSVLCSATAKLAARLTAVVVFPTPPFWFAIAMIRATELEGVRSREYRRRATESTNVSRGTHQQARTSFLSSFHVKHQTGLAPDYAIMAPTCRHHVLTITRLARRRLVLPAPGNGHVNDLLAGLNGRRRRGERAHLHPVDRARPSVTGGQLEQRA